MHAAFVVVVRLALWGDCASDPDDVASAATTMLFLSFELAHIVEAFNNGPASVSME